MTLPQAMIIPNPLDIILLLIGLLITSILLTILRLTILLWKSTSTANSQCCCFHNGSLYPTLSMQLPYFVVLASRLEQLIDELHLSDRESDLLYAVNEAWSKLNDYHTQTVSAQSIATILDPRFKLQTFHSLSWKEKWIMDAKMSIGWIFNAQYTYY